MKQLCRTFYLLVLMSALVLGGCGQQAPATPLVPLENVMWVLENYGETGKLQTPVPKTEITIKFDNTNGKFGGSSGCNQYFGGYQVDKNKLTINAPMGSTMMACPEEIMNQESQYVSILAKAESYKIEEGKLTISGTGKILVFKQK